MYVDYLFGGLNPTENMSQLGLLLIIPNIWKNKMFQTTNQLCIDACIYIYMYRCCAYRSKNKTCQPCSRCQNQQPIVPAGASLST